MYKTSDILLTRTLSTQETGQGWDSYHISHSDSGSGLECPVSTALVTVSRRDGDIFRAVTQGLSREGDVFISFIPTEKIVLPFEVKRWLPRWSFGSFGSYWELVARSKLRIRTRLKYPRVRQESIRRQNRDVKSKNLFRLASENVALWHRCQKGRGRRHKLPLSGPVSEESFQGGQLDNSARILWRKIPG